MTWKAIEITINVDKLLFTGVTESSSRQLR